MELVSSHFSDTLNFGNSGPLLSKCILNQWEAACLSCSGIGTMSPPKYAWVKLLAVFTILQKVTISHVLFVCLSARPFAWNNSVPTGRIFLKFDISVFFKNLSKKFNFYWNLTEEHLLTWILMYAYDSISLSSSWNEKYFRKSCREDQNLYIFF